MRQLFSQPENVQMSRYSRDFYSTFAKTMAVDGQPANIDFEQCGYLFVVGEGGAKQLTVNHTRQVAEGVPAKLLDRAALTARFPAWGWATSHWAASRPATVR